MRVDASVEMGLGHLTRCRTLAGALRSHGAEVRFVCREHPGHQIERLRADGYRVEPLPAPEPSPAAPVAGEDHARWLGVSQSRDAEETRAALEQAPVDWLVVDHYGLDRVWECALRTAVDRIMVIDDLADRRHDCDLLLDQNHVRDAETRYRGLVPESARLLFGPRYAVLHPEYRRARRGRRRRAGRLERVLVFCGGSDPHGLTGRALEALSRPALAHLAVDLVVGANNPHAETIARQAAARPRTRLHGVRPHLADLMADADLAIGAGGTTTWERCCLGLPALVVSIADNQRQICESLAADGLIRYLGHADAVGVDDLGEAILQLARDPDRLRRISVAGARTVDGRGTERVVEAMRARACPPRGESPQPGAPG